MPSQTVTEVDQQLLATIEGTLYQLNPGEGGQWRGLPGMLVRRDGDHVEIIARGQHHQPVVVISTAPLNACFKIDGACIRVFELGAV